MFLNIKQDASVIAGVTKPEQIKQNVAAASWLPDADVIAEIEKIAPQ